jgi:hypothetical protein
MSEIATLRSVPPASAPAAEGNVPPGASPSAIAAALVWQWRRGTGPDPRLAQAAAARRRGVIGAVVGLVVAAILFHWRPTAAAAIAAVAVLLGLLALVSPLGGYRHVMRLVDLFAHGVGVVMTWLLMGIAWVFVFLPGGLLLRATGKLRITRGADARQASYWTPAQEVAPGIEPYKKSF